MGNQLTVPCKSTVLNVSTTGGNLQTNLSFFRLFFYVWIQPRKVIQLILENEPGYFVWPMVIAYSFFWAFDPPKLLSRSKYLSFPLSLFGDVVIGWLFGILSFLIYSRVVWGIGKRSGGKGT